MAREMKDSGIEWIGEIPRSWGICRLRFLCNILTGNQDTQDNDPDGKYPFYVRSPIVEKSNSFTFEGDDILMAGDGVGAGKVFHYVSGKYGCHQRVYSLQKITGISRRFLYYYLQNRFYISIETANSKSTVDSVRLNMLQDFSVTIPNCEEQQSIAVFLDTQCAHIDSVIEKTRAAIEKYKKLKQAVITQAVTKGIRPNRQMKDSGIEWIGEVPSAFVCRKLKSLALLISKGATPKDISIELDNRHIVRFLKSENIVDNHLKEKPEFRITTDIHEGELKRSVLSENDILFVIAGASIGKTAVMEIGLLPANTNQAVSFIRIESKYCFAKKYIWYFLQSEVVKRFIFLFAVQSAQPNLSMENLGSIRMPFPKSKEEVLEIITYLDEKTAAIDSLIQKKEQLITELEAYKKSLIYEYVTGKKEVPVHAH